MIIKGKARGNAASLGVHLSRTDTNEVMEVWELRGVAATDLEGALAEMEAVGSGARTTKGLYHAAINPRDHEQLTEAQKARAIDALEQELGLTGQPRAVVQHVKEGRAHLHVVWSRIDLDRMAAISDSHNYRKHEDVARQLEREFGHERVQGAHVEREDTPRPMRTPSHAEMQQAERTGISPQDMKAELTALWGQTQTGQEFAAGLDARGYLLAKGDRRDFVVLDQAGEAHSLARRIEGARAADVRARMADIDREALPTVEMGRAIQFDRADRAAQLAPEPTAEPVPESVQEAGHESDERATGHEPTDSFTPSGQPDPDRFAEQGIMVAAEAPGQAAEKLSDFVANLLDSVVAPAEPPRRYSALELAGNPAARRESYARDSAARRSREAEDHIREHMEAGRALRPEDIRALTPEHLMNIQAKGDDYLRDLVTRRQRELDSLGRERD